MGGSKPWPEAMEVITGQRSMNAGPLMDYFQPLITWLEKANYQERPGWSDACPQTLKKTVVTCPNALKETSAAPSHNGNVLSIFVLALFIISKLLSMH